MIQRINPNAVSYIVNKFKVYTVFHEKRFSVLTNENVDSGSDVDCNDSILVEVSACATTKSMIVRTVVEMSMKIRICLICQISSCMTNAPIGVPWVKLKSLQTVTLTNILLKFVVR